MAQHVRQVIVNLVANAIKFTARGEILVRVRRQESTVVIDVQDTGIGIPLNARERIFEPFFQVNRTTSQRLGGSGVGLALAKRFAEGLGGALDSSRERGRRGIDVSVHDSAGRRRRGRGRPGGR